jgi:hypothetical protein
MISLPGKLSATQPKPDGEIIGFSGVSGIFERELADGRYKLPNLVLILLSLRFVFASIILSLKKRC